VTERLFPVMHALLIGCPTHVPWRLLSEEWAQRLHGQSLEYLAERGGLDPTEIVANVHRLTWEETQFVSEEQCIAIVKELGK
jgi:hypothetical protein